MQSEFHMTEFEYDSFWLLKSNKNLSSHMLFQCAW